MKTLIFFSLLIIVTSASFAQSKEEQQVAAAVDKLSKAMLDGDGATLTTITDKELVYGHSSGKMESQKQFVDALASGDSDFKTLNTEEQTIIVKGNTAVVRHHLTGNVVDGGKEAAVNLGVLQVWCRDKKQWKLLARQAFKR